MAASVVLPACAPPPRAAARGAALGQGAPSLFEEPWRWTDERGEGDRFADYHDRPIVVAAFYTTCGRTCPSTIRALRGLSVRLAAERLAAHVLLVTLDPRVDTVERMGAFKREAHLPPDWHLLRGSEAATGGVLELLDVHVLDMGPHLIHDARVGVFDGRGRLIQRLACCAFEEEAARLVATHAGGNEAGAPDRGAPARPGPAPR